MAEPTHYQVLGLKEDADARSIRQRFRQLARQLHPDLNPADATAHERFVRVNHAYQVLSDPARRADYDLTLRDHRARQGATGRTAQARPAQPPPPREAGRAGVTATSRTRFRAAEQAYFGGRHTEARAMLEQIIRRDPRFAPAHELLGHLHEMGGRLQEALTAYTLAAQLDPQNARVLGKLERAAARLQQQRGGETRARAAARSRRVLSPQQQLARRVAIMSAGASALCLALGMIAISPGERLGWPVAPEWSDHLLLAMVFCGALLGLTLSGAHVIRSADEELFFPSLSPESEGVGLGLTVLLVLASLVFFYLACALYVISALVREAFSVSLLLLFGGTLLIVVGFSLVVPSQASGQVLMLGGNVIFPCALLGWVVGDLFRPPF